MASTAAAAAAAKSLQLCLTLCDPRDGSSSGSPVPGILQAKHWSGLPFPSPMNESEKWKWSRSVLSHSSRPHGLQPTRLLHPWDFPGKSTGVGCHCLLWMASTIGLKRNKGTRMQIWSPFFILDHSKYFKHTIYCIYSWENHWRYHSKSPHDEDYLELLQLEALHHYYQHCIVQPG